MIRILIVDDNRDLEEAFRIAAENEGVRVTFCTSGADALHAIAEEKEKFDVALIDLAMYPMDGTSLAELIRSNEKARLAEQMPVAAYTAQVIDDVVEEMLDENHIQKIFRKPIPPIDLIREVKEWIH